jgi:hypothetical protein
MSPLHPEMMDDFESSSDEGEGSGATPMTKAEYLEMSRVKYRQDTKKRHHRLHVEEPGWGLDDPLLPPALHTHNFSCEEKRLTKCAADIENKIMCGFSPKHHSQYDAALQV